MQPDSPRPSKPSNSRLASRPPAIAEAPSPPNELQLRRRGLPAALQIRKWTDLPAWAVSVIVHVVLFVLLVALWQPLAKGTNGGESERAVGIAVVRKTQNGQEYFLVDGGSGSESQVENSAASAAAAASSSDSGPPIDLSAILDDFSGGAGTNVGLNDIDEALGSTGLGGSGASGSGPGRGNQSKTSFLGVEGEGNSFVYVLDRSESMASPGGKPLATAKRELANSLQSLSDQNQFQIVFYNDQPIFFRSPLSGQSGLLYARDNERTQAANFVKKVAAAGGTEHISAIKLGLQYGSDVLFFLTDANEPAPSRIQLTDIIRRCDSSGTTIHTIEFGNGGSGGNGWIRQLATETGGKYRYVDVTRLP